MKKNGRFLVGLVGVAAIVTYLIWTGVNDAVVYYLTPTELQLLMRTLQPFCLPGTSMLAFVATQKEMPPAPSAYWIGDEDTVHYEIREGRSRPCPRYLEQDLLKQMPGLTVESRYQLRNGMLEYVLSYRNASRASSPVRYPLGPNPRSTPTPYR